MEPSALRKATVVLLKPTGSSGYASDQCTRCVGTGSLIVHIGNLFTTLAKPLGAVRIKHSRTPVQA